MNPEKNLDEILNRYITSASKEEVESHCDQVFQQLQARAKNRSANPPIRSVRRWQWPAVAAIAAAITVAVLLPIRVLRSAPAVLEDASGSRNIHYGEVVRSSDDMNAMLSMSSGARVEMRSMSELSLERTDDGVRIRLNNGGVIVDAAEQHGESLYVQTKDMMASVGGAVSLVRAEEQGSRVAAIGGEVRVQQGMTETTLRSGEQVASNPKMESLSVKEEVAWSREAVTHEASLQLAASAPQERIAFEVATIRPAAAPPPRAAGERGAGGGVMNSRPGPDGCTHGTAGYSLQIDPRRFATTRTTLLQIVALAYPDALDGSSPFTNCGVRSKLGFLSGGPEWVKTEMWDVQATIPEGAFPALSSQQLSSDPKLKQMLQTLLEERFKLVMRRETREMPTYLLKVGKDGPKFNGRPSDMVFITDDTPTPGWDKVPPGTRGIFRIVPGGNLAFEAGRGIVDGVRTSEIIGIDMSMAAIASGLTASTGRVVIDQTGLKGTYSYHAQFPDDGVQSTLRQAMEKFGFRLEESKAPMEVWVIGRAERPSEN
jgi:uncharacterized protein (TIGR03435 family)